MTWRSPEFLIFGSTYFSWNVLHFFFTWRNVTYFEWYLKITSTLKTPLTPIIQNQSLPCVLVQTLCRYFQCNICHLSSLPYLSVCLSVYLSIYHLSIIYLLTSVSLFIRSSIHLPQLSWFMIFFPQRIKTVSEIWRSLNRLNWISSLGPSSLFSQSTISTFLLKHMLFCLDISKLFIDLCFLTGFNLFCFSPRYVNSALHWADA